MHQLEACSGSAHFHKQPESFITEAHVATPDDGPPKNSP